MSAPSEDTTAAGSYDAPTLLEDPLTERRSPPPSYGTPSPDPASGSPSIKKFASNSSTPRPTTAKHPNQGVSSAFAKPSGSRKTTLAAHVAKLDAEFKEAQKKKLHGIPGGFARRGLHGGDTVTERFEKPKEISPGFAESQAGTIGFTVGPKKEKFASWAKSQSPNRPEIQPPLCDKYYDVNVNAATHFLEADIAPGSSIRSPSVGTADMSVTKSNTTGASPKFLPGHAPAMSSAAAAFRSRSPRFDSYAVPPPSEGATEIPLSTYSTFSRAASKQGRYSESASMRSKSPRLPSPARSVCDTVYSTTYNTIIGSITSASAKNRGNSWSRSKSPMREPTKPVATQSMYLPKDPNTDPESSFCKHKNAGRISFAAMSDRFALKVSDAPAPGTYASPYISCGMAA